MSVNTLLSTVILVTFLVTIVLAVGSYTAYKLRERRRPALDPAADGSAPIFFERIYLGTPDSRQDTATDANGTEQTASR
ncbi:MAG TPA: hypothetical protein VHM67_16515 [Gemmatimonadaceae bacterium]|nr:hypothetical protein [Gemmatimonadaceae bacterium]